MADYISLNVGANPNLFLTMIRMDQQPPPPYYVFTTIDNGVTYQVIGAYRNQRLATREAERQIKALVPAYVCFFAGRQLNKPIYIKNEMLPPH